MHTCSGFQTYRIDIYKLTIYIRRRDSLSLSDPLTFKDNHLVTMTHKRSRQWLLTTSRVLSHFPLTTFLWISFPFEKQKLWSSHF
jgi:hypothetical protein